MKTLKLSHPSSKKCQIDIFDDGKIIDQQTFLRTSAGPRNAMAEQFGLDRLKFLQFIEGNLNAPIEIQMSDLFPEPPAEDVTQGHVLVRGRLQKASDGMTVSADTQLAAFEAALRLPGLPPEPLIAWEEQDDLCALDVDYHHRQYDHRPTEDMIKRTLDQIQPVPVMGWMTRGHGARLMFVRMGDYTAAELASVAALSWQNFDADATFELKTITRYPAGPVHRYAPTMGLGHFQRMMTKRPSDEAVDEIRTEYGFELGRKYSHDRCLIDPGHVSNGAEPVLAGDIGMICHSCAGRGMVRGSKKPGFVPWSSLVPGVDDRIMVMAKHFCHWEHAKIVIACRMTLPVNVARLTYQTLLKILHGPHHPLIPKVFTQGANLIRTHKQWTDLQGLYEYKQFADALALLPACQETIMVPEGMKTRPNPATLAHMLQNDDIEDHGYPSLKPIRGCEIFGVHNETGDDPKFIQPSESVTKAGKMYYPRYLPPGERMNVEAAWQMLEDICPRISRAYVKLLIAAKGVNEGGMGMPTYILCVGPSGSGKSQTIHIAASICGDTALEPIWSADETRYRQGLHAAAEQGSFVVTNEIMKTAIKAKQSPKEAMDVVLSLTPESTSHKMYHGPMQFRYRPVFVFTDVQLSPGVTDDTQLARRLAYARLHGRAVGDEAWDTRMLERGISRLGDIRIRSYEHAAMCNAILSDVIDEFFTSPISLPTIVRRLGFHMLEDVASANGDRDALLQDLFYYTCKAAEDTKYKSRVRGNGWKFLPWSRVEDPLTVAWLNVADAEMGDRRYTSRACDEATWRLVLGVSEDIRIHVKRSQTAFFVRFTDVSGERVNEALIPNLEQWYEDKTKGRIHV